jgi:2-oxoisovalerate dehydrogenase E1 component
MSEQILTLADLRATYFFEEAVRIRLLETRLLDLFGQGRLNGTIHTCIGQEYSALAIVKQLTGEDFVVSNHRCHGHYLAKTGDYRGLIAELMGKRSGVSGGVGGSQHLCADGFLSNGVQGGIVPVAAGLALANKLNRNSNIGVVFIGDGTLGEGVVYESLNIISKWNIPLLVVLENNYYAQATSQDLTLAGEILARPRSFGISTYESSTRCVEELFTNARESLEYVRNFSKPAFHLINTFRLGPHSKGDDFRDPVEIANAREVDPIDVVASHSQTDYQILKETVSRELESIIAQIEGEEEQTFAEYVDGAIASRPTEEAVWVTKKFSEYESGERLITQINSTFHKLMSEDDKILFLGEDILSPYGGAFKATAGLSDKFPDRVLTTPISEAGIIGVSNGLALGGYRPFIEIMFGDFLTLGVDQLVNHAAKFHQMYNRQLCCPTVIRTPMGGGRGYGPTHSQTLEKILIGTDGLKIVALNLLIHPRKIYQTIADLERDPIVVIENKKDYARRVGVFPDWIKENFQLEVLTHRYPIVRLRPSNVDADISIITYGGVVSDALTAIESLFFEYEILSELIVPSQISPLEKKLLRGAITGKAVIAVEEGSEGGGFTSEVVAALSEALPTEADAPASGPARVIARVCSTSGVIPAAGDLERTVLVSPERIVNMALSLMESRQGVHG